MSVRKPSGQGIFLLLALVVLVGFMLISRSGGVGVAAQEQGPQSPQVPAPFVLSYQSRLLDPTTGDPKPDGIYTITFRLYTVGSGGSAIWQEIKDVDVTRGTFSTLLGDVTPLNPNDFNGQELWLGVKVGADTEATPRQLLSYVGYALYAHNSATLDGLDSTDFANASHQHAGGDISSGTVADARIAGTIARDAEVTSAVAGHTADPDAHHVRYTDNDAWNAVLNQDGPGSGLNADYLDGYHYSSFSFTSHTHDNRYYTESESNSRFVNATGDTMTGALTVPQVRYSSPRYHYFVVGSSAFVPGSNVDYFNTYGNGGAYINSNTLSGAMVAPVHLPHGAVVTSFRVYFRDVSSRNMNVYLYAEPLTGGGFVSMATVVSSGTGGYINGTDTTISNATINNTAYSYLVYAWADPWDYSNLQIKGAVITYYLTEAP